MASDSDDDRTNNLLLTMLPDEEETEEEEEEPRSIVVDDLDSSNAGQNSHRPLERRHCLQSIGVTLTTRQLPSRGLSFQLWPAASALVSLLDCNPAALLLRPSSAPRLRILELGSGTGLVGIAAAAVLGAEVTLTDLPHVLPNLQANAQANVNVVAARGGSLAVHQLTWGDEEDHAALSSSSQFDAVIASDVVYYDYLVDPLLRTLSWFLKGEAAFIMAHLKRWKKTDAIFFKKARRMFEVAVVHTDAPLPGNRIGVVVYGFTAKKNAT